MNALVGLQWLLLRIVLMIDRLILGDLLVLADASCKVSGRIDGRHVVEFDELLLAVDV